MIQVSKEHKCFAGGKGAPEEAPEEGVVEGMRLTVPGGFAFCVLLGAVLLAVPPAVIYVGEFEHWLGIRIGPTAAEVIATSIGAVAAAALALIVIGIPFALPAWLGRRRQWPVRSTKYSRNIPTRPA